MFKRERKTGRPDLVHLSFRPSSPRRPSGILVPQDPGPHSSHISYLSNLSEERIYAPSWLFRRVVPELAFRFVPCHPEFPSAPP